MVADRSQSVVSAASGSLLEEQRVCDGGNKDYRLPSATTYISPLLQ